MGWALTHLYKSDGPIFEHRHLDRYQLMESEYNVDTTMDDWDTEFCREMPKTEEGKALYNRYYKKTGDEIDKALKIIERQTGIHEIQMGGIYPGKIIVEKKWDEENSIEFYNDLQDLLMKCEEEDEQRQKDSNTSR